MILRQEPRAGSASITGELLLATVDVAGSSSTGTTLIFPGGATATAKRYKRIYNATYSAGDRVLVAKISGTYVILGRIV